MGCASSKSEGLDNNKPAQPVTYTTAPPSNASFQPPTVQQPSEKKKKKRKAATNLGLLSTLVN
jgi:hypothetical protein